MGKRSRSAIGIAALLFIAGCDVPQTSSGGRTGNVPEQVLALAAPGQNAMTARVLPEDNCYWYEHRGPVETTLLPLRTPAGNPICTQPKS